VLDPLRVVITNYPEGGEEELEAINNPEDPEMGTRQVPFSRVIYIEKGDFREEPPKKFFRLAPGREVRLRYAYFITCENVIKDESGQIVELHCRYDPQTRGGAAPDGRKVKGTLHWVSADHCLTAQVRVYDRLFVRANPAGDEKEGFDFRDSLNPESLQILTGCKVEPSLAGVQAGTTFQFERQGYFCADPDSTPQRPVFNRTVSLKDTWAKIAEKEGLA
jgi:glutaminyl-tRNA synthetase